MPELGVMTVVQQGDTVLLTQREDFEVWCLPGGAVDANEQPDVAAAREVREETGLDVRVTRLVAVITRPHASAEGRLTLVFAATPLGGMLRPDSREVADLGFFTPNALPEPLMLEHRQILAEAMRGATGGLWLSARRMPMQFRDRAALYRWRDEAGLTRPEAYRELIEIAGEAPLVCLVPAPANQHSQTPATL
jgi:ADP-ribose pyrophosphatase YjhB (NUDIX family)